MMHLNVNPDNALCFANRDDWREWLSQNHDIMKEIWLIYHKKKSNMISVSYNDAVEEALCFGWIDSTVKTIDEKRYMQKFTPRKSNSVWANSNKERVRKMITEGKMTPFGMAKIEEAKSNGNWESVPESIPKKLEIPEDLSEALSKSKKAYANFLEFAPSYQRIYIYWINFSKRKETRMKRIQKVVAYSEERVIPGML